MTTIQRFWLFVRYSLLFLVLLIPALLIGTAISVGDTYALHDWSSSDWQVHARGRQMNAPFRGTSLPDVVYLGEGPGTFTTPLDNFIVKKMPLDFVFEPGPTYTTYTAERIWGIRGAHGAPPTIWDQEVSLGPIEGGCIARYVGIDDDLDGRRNAFFLNGEQIELITEGMVFSGSFVIPEDGEIVFVAEDTVGGWYAPCDEQVQPTPTNTPTPTPTATPTPTFTPTPTATPTPTFTPTPTKTPLVANFSVSPTNGILPLEVNITNLSTGDFDHCLWDYGDGNSSEICDNHSYTYDVSGTFAITLTVDGPGGNSVITKVYYITVYEPAKADFSASPKNGAPPFEVIFTNLSSGDFDQCQWDFGDGGTLATCGNPKHRYKDEGDYTVSLTVKGSGGENTMTVDQCVKVAYYRLFLPGVLRASQ